MISLSYLIKPASIFFIAILPGCSLGEHIGKHAIDYNRTVESAENKMFLLNIVRAHQSYPMHFTRIAKINGALETEASLGIDVTETFNPTAATVSSAPSGSVATTGVFKPAISAKTAPTFDIQILDTKAFTQGLQAPISPSAIRLYESQGWPRALLLHALAEEVDVFVTLPGEDGNAEDQVVEKVFVCTIKNEVGNNKQFERFSELVSLLSEVQDIRYESGVTSESQYGPLIDADKSDGLALLVEARKAGLGAKVNKDEPNKFFLVEKQTTGAFIVPKGQNLSALLARYAGHKKNLPKFTESAVGIRLEKIAAEVSNQQVTINSPFVEKQENLNNFCSVQRISEVRDAIEADSPSTPVERRLRQIQERKEKEKRDQSIAEGKKPELERYALSVDIRLRSTQGVLYYLGEHLSAQQFGPIEDREPRKIEGRDVLCEGKPCSIFVVQKGEIEGSLLSVSFRGEKYSIPPWPISGRSLQLLSLVRQQFALNLEADNFPTTQVVRFLN